MTGTVAVFAIGAVVAAAGAAVVPVMPAFNAAVIGPNVAHRVPVFAIGIGANGGFPTLNIARLDRQAISNFALFEFDCPKVTLSAETIFAKGIVVTFCIAHHVVHHNPFIQIKKPHIFVFLGH